MGGVPYGCHRLKKKFVIWQQTGNKQDVRLNSIALRIQHSRERPVIRRLEKLILA